MKNTPTSEPPAATPSDQVRARWVDVQTVMVPGQGLVGYGAEVMVSAEQLAAAAHPTIVWDDAWVPSPDLLTQSTLEG